jgi:hypothetical protein
LFIEIRILIFYSSQISDPGVKKAPNPGSGSATLGLIRRKRTGTLNKLLTSEAVTVGWDQLGFSTLLLPEVCLVQLAEVRKSLIFYLNIFHPSYYTVGT